MIISKLIFEPTELRIKGVTLLSFDEANKYLSRDDRIYNGWWWLSSQGNNILSSAIVFQNGDCSRYCSFAVDEVGYVRPALKISNLRLSNFNIGDIFTIGKYKFKIISNNLAWLYSQDIGTSEFNINTRKKNIYNKSYIKEYINSWFKNEILKEDINYD